MEAKDDSTNNNNNNNNNINIIGRGNSILVPGATIGNTGLYSSRRDPYTFVNFINTSGLRPLYANMQHVDEFGYDQAHFRHVRYNEDNVDVKERVLSVFHPTNKGKWAFKDDMTLVEFEDGTEAIKMSLGIRQVYHSRCHHFEDLRLTTTGAVTSTPTTGVLLPTIHILDHDHPDCLMLSPEDCQMIVKVAKNDFGPSKDLSDVPGHKHYFFFGQRVYDIGSERSVVVVGETFTHAYVLCHQSICQDVNNNMPIVPLKRDIRYLAKTRGGLALSYHVVRECARMAEYTVDFPQYRIHRFLSRRIDEEYNNDRPDLEFGQED